MGFQDRSYYRDRPSGGGLGGALTWITTGSVPLFTVFGIRVRAHASLIIIIGLVLLFGLGQGSNVQMRVQSMSILFLVILLHEFGHCFAARWTGGNANDILMTPLGGLAMAYARRKPWPQFVTVAGGPLVNVIICLICGAGLFFTIGVWPLGPWQFGRFDEMLTPGWFQVSSYLFWFYSVSYFLLLFNLLPIFPLDGGQLLQSILWKPMGYYKSMLLAVNIGIGGAVLMMMIGVATFGALMGGFLLIMIGLMCLMTCLNMRRTLLAEGQWGFSEEDAVDYGASLYNQPKRKAGIASKWNSRRHQKRQAAERAEQQSIDAILAKVSAKGMHSLSWWEKRTLKKATERQRLAALARERQLKM